jgi:hypothetical protein
MSDQNSGRKVTRVGSENPSKSNEKVVFEASAESKGKATQLRVFAFLAWVVAIGIQLYAIFSVLPKASESMILLIGLIVGILILVFAGSTLWKKANRLDPASEANPTKFFIQNQLGVIMTVLAFLPLVILIFTNKDMDGKQKGIVGTIAVVAMLLAGLGSADFNPPSIEQYTQQIEEVQSLNFGRDFVYWTRTGTRYHLFSDCSHISSARTDEIFEGGVADAREIKNITELCQRCRNKALKEREIEEVNLQEALDEVEEAVEQN